MATRRRYEGEVPKRERVWLADCVHMAEKMRQEWGGIAPRARGGRKPTIAGRKLLDGHLLRRRLGQGRPQKCSLVSEFLWDWFVDVRASVSAKVSPRFVLMKARQIAGEILKASVKTGQYTVMPQLDKHWLYRWRRNKGVSFRRPNRRYKASKKTLMVRLRCMWLNVVRVRRLAQRFLGRDLAEAIYGCDEKPLHFNENGSKATRTLEIEGAPSVPLKENHAHTRERCSLMTTVSSCPEAVRQPRGLPVAPFFGPLPRAGVGKISGVRFFGLLGPPRAGPSIGRGALQG